MPIASQNRMIKDPLVGKMVNVISGKYKGHRGVVTYADDRQAMVELTSQCKKVPIDKINVKEVNPEDLNSRLYNGGKSMHQGEASVYGGATVYDGGKTPRINTPSYYP